MDWLIEIVTTHFNYMAYVAIMMVGLYAMAAKGNLIKKLIGLGIFQSPIMLLYVAIGTKKGATIPILAKGATNISPEDYINPLPHVLMLTAIVVSVTTLGVALALVQKIHKHYKTIEEDEILKELRG